MVLLSLFTDRALCHTCVTRRPHAIPTSCWLVMFDLKHDSQRHNIQETDAQSQINCCRSAETFMIPLRTHNSGDVSLSWQQQNTSVSATKRNEAEIRRLPNRLVFKVDASKNKQTKNCGIVFEFKRSQSKKLWSCRESRCSWRWRPYSCAVRKTRIWIVACGKTWHGFIIRMRQEQRRCHVTCTNPTLLCMVKFVWQPRLVTAPVHLLL